MAAILNYIEASIATVTPGSPDTFTLADISGSPNFNDHPLMSGTRNVRYTAVEYASSARTAISKVQSGIGSLNLSTMVLTQTLIQETWNGTTFDNTAPAELTFTADTDTTRVYCTLLAQDFMRSVPGTANISGALGGSTSFGIVPMNIGNGSGTFAAVADREYYRAILWAGQCPIDQATIRTGSVTTGNCKLGWYECGPDGLPGALLKDFGAFAGGVGGSGVNSTQAVSSFCPPPGWYWELSIFDAAVSPQNITPSFAMTPAGQTSTGIPIAGYTRTGSYATGLPASGATSSPSAVVTGANISLPSFSYRMAA